MKKITLYFTGLLISCGFSAQAVNFPVNSNAPLNGTPTEAAPTPEHPAGNVLSLFSDAYTNVPVDTWQTEWSVGIHTETQIAGNSTKRYSDLSFAGIETVANQININNMLYLHMDIWTPNMTTFRVKLVDFGPNAIFGGGDDTEHELVFNPSLNGWNSLNIDLANFTGLQNRNNIAQLIISGLPAGEGIVFIDNIYFHNVVSSTPQEPTVAAPTPTRLAENVISLFSNTYNNVPVDTWQTSWSAGVVSNFAVEGNDIKKYESLNFVGIETVANQIDATEMLFFHMDIWTPNMNTFRVKLVDFGADGAFGGGNDTEHEITFTPNQSGWVGLEIPMSDFVGLTSREHIAQIILSGTPVGQGIVFVDNVYFHKEGVVVPVEPTVAAATPTRPAQNVISLFSNAYTNVPVDTWQTSWSVGTVSDVQIEGNDTKKYENLNFVGIETVNNQINATSMLYFHMDIWTPNMTSFRIKLVDFGADGAFGGGNDTEHEITFTPAQAGWVSYEIPLSDFSGLINRANIAQLILSGTPSGSGIVFVDNVYFHNVPVVDPNVPTVAANTPNVDPALVQSMFSESYTNLPVDTWKTSWSAANFQDVEIAGNPTKRYTSLDFVGIEATTDPIDASQMNYFHIDVWTPNMTAFRIKLVDFGANGTFGGGDDVEHELSFTPTQSQWNTYTIPLSDFTGLVTRSNIAQLILSGNPTAQGILFVDNVFFSAIPLSVDTPEQTSLALFPNPVNDVLQISTAEPVTRMEVYNSLGQLVFENKGAALTQINTSAWTVGTYIAKIQIADQTITRKIVKK